MENAQVEKASMAEGEHVQILMDLGLTLLQARIYLALSQTGTATIKTVSKASSIARQDIYRIMPTLQKLGLAEKILALPTMYKATPIKEGYYLLLQNKTQQHTELQTKTIALIKKAQKGKDKKTPKDEETQFVITASKKLVWKKLDDGINNAQMSIDACCEWHGVRSGLLRNLKMFKRAMKRGAKIRIITEEHEDNSKPVQSVIQTLRENPLFEIRYLLGKIPIKVTIHDCNEVNLCLAPPPEHVDVPSLWSNNPQFVKAIRAYYEDLWNKALDAPGTLTSKSVKQKQPQTNSSH